MEELEKEQRNQHAEKVVVKVGAKDRHGEQRVNDSGAQLVANFLCWRANNEQ